MWWTGDSITEHPTLLPGFLLVYFLANLAGFHTGVRLVQGGHTRLVWLIFIGGFGFFAAWVAIQPYRTLSLGTYREWEAGTAPWIWTDPAFVGLLSGAAVLFFVVLAWLYRKLHRESVRHFEAGTAAVR
jgi:hypothetical protein